MDRRQALASLSGIAATLLLVDATTGSRPAFALESLTPADYRHRTVMVGTFSMETSQLALTRAQHPRVKQFAQIEIAEQIAIAQALTNENNPSPADLDAQHASLLQALKGTDERAFDLTYVQGQLRGHNELLEIQNSYLNGAPGDRDQAHIAIIARAVIMSHITLLTDLQTIITS